MTAQVVRAVRVSDDIIDIVIERDGRPHQLRMVRRLTGVVPIVEFDQLFYRIFSRDDQDAAERLLDVLNAVFSGHDPALPVALVD
jgi:hypothetical protein